MNFMGDASQINKTKIKFNKKIGKQLVHCFDFFCYTRQMGKLSSDFFPSAIVDNFY